MKVSKNLPQCPVKIYNNFDQIRNALKSGNLYEHDNIADVIKDYLIHPRVIECRLNSNKNFGDCDDHAIYWCTAIKKSKLARKVWFSFFTMTGRGVDDSINSHAVCVFLGYDNKYYWCDYKNPNLLDKPSNFQVKSANLYGCDALCGAMWEIDAIKEDDTPIFGKITRVLPEEDIIL
jgi:hypothetical protein